MWCTVLGQQGKEQGTEQTSLVFLNGDGKIMPFLFPTEELMMTLGNHLFLEQVPLFKRIKVKVPCVAFQVLQGH